jgi:hypothetical protein
MDSPMFHDRRKIREYSAQETLMRVPHPVYSLDPSPQGNIWWDKGIQGAKRPMAKCTFTIPMSEALTFPAILQFWCNQCEQVLLLLAEFQPLTYKAGARVYIVLKHVMLPYSWTSYAEMAMDSEMPEFLPGSVREQWSRTKWPWFHDKIALISAVQGSFSPRIWASTSRRHLLTVYCNSRQDSPSHRSGVRMQLVEHDGHSESSQASATCPGK